MKLNKKCRQLKNKKVQIKQGLLPCTAKYPPTCCELRYCNWQCCCYVCLCLHLFNAPLHPLKPYDLTRRGESGDRECELSSTSLFTQLLSSDCLHFVLHPDITIMVDLALKKQLSVLHLVRLLVTVHQHTQFGCRGRGGGCTKMSAGWSYTRQVVQAKVLQKFSETAMGVQALQSLLSVQQLLLCVKLKMRYFSAWVKINY